VAIIDIERADLSKIPRTLLEEIARVACQLSGYEVPHSDAHFFIVHRDAYWMLHAKLCIALERIGVNVDEHLRALEKDQKEKDVVRKAIAADTPIDAIFREAVLAGSRPVDVVERLNRMGFTTRRGTPWAYDAVYARLLVMRQKLLDEQAQTPAST
jgi:hypothetical protein